MSNFNKVHCKYLNVLYYIYVYNSDVSYYDLRHRTLLVYVIDTRIIENSSNTGVLWTIWTVDIAAL